jgi:hypothetical protein
MDSALPHTATPLPAIVQTRSITQQTRNRPWPYNEFQTATAEAIWVESMRRSSSAYVAPKRLATEIGPLANLFPKIDF